MAGLDAAGSDARACAALYADRGAAASAERTRPLTRCRLGQLDRSVLWKAVACLRSGPEVEDDVEGAPEHFRLDFVRRDWSRCMAPAPIVGQ